MRMKENGADARERRLQENGEKEKTIHKREGMDGDMIVYDR